MLTKYTELELIQLVLAEMIQPKDTNIRVLNCDEPSAIAAMYANMINKGIYSINKVPKRYIEEVDSILNRR